MAVEKTLNTRLKLKIDSYENWIANDPVLLDGEVALATVSIKQDGIANYVPSVLMKVGQGGKKYSELDYTYAKAADVINACKSESALTAFINNVIASAGIATDEAISALTNRVALAESDIDALEVLVGDEAVATQISTAISTAKSDLIGTDEDTADSNTIKGAKKYADDLNTAIDTRIDSIEAAVGEGGSVTSQITTAIEALDKADVAVEGKYVSAVSEENGIITVTRADLPDFAGLENKVTTLIGTDTGKSARSIANEELAAQLIPETAKESLDTLQEIAAWIQAHPDDASAMNAAIDALEAKVGDDKVSSQITAAIDALKNGDIATMQSAIDAVEAAIETLNGTGEGSISKTVSDAVAALDVEDAAVAHQVVTAVSETDGKIAVTRAQLSTDDITAGTEVWIFDCGNSSV